MVLQEMSAPERGMKDFRHEKCDTKLTLIVLVQLKKSFYCIRTTNKNIERIENWN